MPFEKTEEGWLVEMPDEEHMGPAMRRLNERQRRFVCALSVFGGDQPKAYVFAGYETKNARSASAAASRLSNSDDVKEAIKEEAWRRLDYASILAVSTMVELSSPSNPDKAIRLKAANMLADRTGFHAKTEHHIVHEDRRTTKELLEFIQTTAARLGVTHALGLPAPVVDAEYEEVVEDATGLEDIL